MGRKKSSALQTIRHNFNFYISLRPAIQRAYAPPQIKE
jgi:isocitrate/isopropylmalate dehydrogenase